MIKILKMEETPKNTEEKVESSLVQKVAYNVVTSSLFRKGIFVGTMYVAGGTIVATVGLGPTIAVGTLIWLL